MLKQIKYSKIKFIISCITVILIILGQANGTLVNSNSIVVDEIEYYMQTDKAVYDLGEEVDMLYRVTNLGAEEVTFHFTDLVTHYFTAKYDGNLIWDAPKVGLPAESEFVLQQNEYVKYYESWDMFDNLGLLITPDNYEITGSFHPVLLIEKDRYVPVSVFINVVPEPTTLLFFGLGALALLRQNNRKK
ncbi:MAG: PEP-CTERM sorting domain-containing protein [Planctomycetota bacterium]|jgi:hypothetical protein